MKTHLRGLLDPGDDGRAFTDAVVLRASGALYRRRQAAEAATETWAWLERWARPWVVAALALLAVASVVPALRQRGASQAYEPVAEATMLAVPSPDVMLAVSYGR